MVNVSEEREAIRIGKKIKFILEHIGKEYNSEVMEGQLKGKLFNYRGVVFDSFLIGNKETILVSASIGGISKEVYRNERIQDQDNIIKYKKERWVGILNRLYEKVEKA